MKKGIVLKAPGVESYWVNTDDTKSYTRSAAPLEEPNTIKLIETILSEFEQTSPKEKERMKKRLEDWLLNSSENDLNLEQVGTVRDFIYEMF